MMIILEHSGYEITVYIEDDLYRADIAGLPYCTEWADSEGEVIELAKDTIDTLLEYYGENFSKRVDE